MLTLEQIDDLEDYSYFWDTHGMWEIRQYHSRMYSIAVEFSDSNGPGVMELKRMRQWLPELGQLPPAECTNA